MSVTVKDLDKGIKSILRDIILKKLFTEYGGLPLADETDKVKDILTIDMMNNLKEKIEDYYESFVSNGSNLDVNVSADDYMDIYFQRI